MKPHYYLMKEKKILRLEEEDTFSRLPDYIQEQRLMDASLEAMTQSEANWRVALYRDEIMEVDEFVEYLSSQSA